MVFTRAPCSRTAVPPRRGGGSGVGFGGAGTQRGTRRQQLPDLGRWEGARAGGYRDRQRAAFPRERCQHCDLDVLLFSHLHVDHTGDLPGLVVASASDGRTRPLPIFGPAGNKYMPSSVSFVRALFDSKRGAFRYLGDFVGPLGRHTYKLQPHNVHARTKPMGPVLKQVDTVLGPVFHNKRLSISAAPVTHGNAPALAWRSEQELIQAVGVIVVALYGKALLWRQSAAIVGEGRF